jgi:hypothetical protein
MYNGCTEGSVIKPWKFAIIIHYRSVNESQIKTTRKKLSFYIELFNKAKWSKTMQDSGNSYSVVDFCH